MTSSRKVLVPYSNRYADPLIKRVSRRFQYMGRLVTTNKAFAACGEVFTRAACVVSLSDHLMHRAEVVRVEGESYRAKTTQERMAACAR
jgi:DNA replication protein DnaC